MHAPTPVAWDAAGKPGPDAASLINPTVRLDRDRDGAWTYSVNVDPKWLHAKERVYPVSIDPIWQPGPSYMHSIKTGGAVFNGQLHIGNSLEPQDRYWRAFVGFPYGAAPGRFIADAEVGVAYIEGSSAWRGGEVSHATCIGYDCVGPYLSGFQFDTGTGWTGGNGVAQELVNAFAQGNTGVTFMLRGDETSGQFTRKRVNAGLYIDYWDFPTVSQSAPADGATQASLTPTLSGTGSGCGPNTSVRCRVCGGFSACLGDTRRGRADDGAVVVVPGIGHDHRHGPAVAVWASDP